MNPLQELFEREMDRKEFIVYLGLLLLAVTGISGLLKNLKKVVNPVVNSGFGSGPYGGTRTKESA